jgi:D-glycero-D-manno-heptose 1,7-bisphosphate phosphatase
VITTAFLDRDGTINVKAPEGAYVERWEEFRFLPGAEAAIRRLNDSGIRVVVVTNQRGIALGRLTEADLEGIHARMRAALGAAGARVDAIFHCPHDHDECDCRKPGIGMFLEARAEIPGISFAESAVIGDSLSDMEPGARLGCQTVLLDPKGKRAAEAAAAGIPIDLVAGTLAEAVDRLLEES